MPTQPEKAGVLLQMPQELHYLIEPALRYGCRAEWDVFAFLDRASADDLMELALVAERILRNDHSPIAFKFLNSYPLNKYDECAQLYFFFGLLDYAGLKFDRVPGAE